MAKDTKNRIMESALEMFSKNGYTGTNIRELAGSLGLGKSSLYRHFGSKEEIFDAIYMNMKKYYDEHFGSVEKLTSVPKNCEELMTMTMRMVNFTVNDENIIKMRKILQIEQFRDERMKELASKYFLYDTEAIFKKVFEEMMKNGSMKQGDAKMLAFSYTTPISALIHLCDREPGEIPEAMGKVECFVRFFIENYGTENEEK